MLSLPEIRRLVEDIDKALERRTPTTTAPTFVASDQLREWLLGWRRDRELLLHLRGVLRRMEAVMVQGDLP